MKKDRIKNIIKLVLDDIAGIYLYILAFYILNLVLSLFFEEWKLFFYWPAFNAIVIVFGVLSLLSGRGRRAIMRFLRMKQGFGKEGAGSIKAVSKLVAAEKLLVSAFFLFGKNVAGVAAGFAASRVKKLRRKDCLKVGIIVIVLLYSLLAHQVKGFDLVVLFYALFSVLFVIDSRIAAAVALILLSSIPFLLIGKKEHLAETMAIYAYYFLVITVITQIREYMRESKKIKGDKKRL